MDAENGNVEMTEIDNFQMGHGSHVRLEDFEFDFGRRRKFGEKKSQILCDVERGKGTLENFCQKKKIRL